MTSIVKLEALSGVRDDGPLCYLLQVDEAYVLLDCGWDEHFDLAYMDAVKRHVPHLSAVLISHPDPAHLGALPYLVAKCGLTCPVYATVPVYKMGQMFMYDWVNGRAAGEEFTLFTLDHVDAAFERVQQVKYNQTVLLKGDNGLQVTPLPAGHMIGGAMWRISKMGDDEIVYAVDFNHKKERHLNGCSFDTISRPHVLITDAFNAMYTQPRRKQRDEQLITRMLHTVRDGGDCLVVIDTAGRVLEIAHLLDQLWCNPDAGLATYNLAMLSHVASSVVEFAKSQVEWMSDKILKSFETGRSNPFQFRNVQLCHSHHELMRVRSPKVVLCSGLSMESGFSRELFLEWSTDTRNTVIVTGRSGERTLGAKLIRMAEMEAKGEKRPGGRNVRVEVRRRIRLEGAELEAHRQRKRAEEERLAREKLEERRRVARAGAVAEAAHDDDDSSDSDDDEALASAVAAVTGRGGRKGGEEEEREEEEKAGKVTSRRSTAVGGGAGGVGGGGGGTVQPQSDRQPEAVHDLLIKWQQHQKTSFFKQHKKSFPMFPFVEEKVKWDDYGEVIRPEEFMLQNEAGGGAAVGGTGTGAVTAAGGTQQVPQQVDMSRPPPPLGQTDAQSAVVPAPPVLVQEEWPTKCVKYVAKLEVLCRVEFIDFEGRSDGESLKKLLAQIKPKQLIIVHGSNEATRHLAAFAKESGIVQGQIFAPLLGELVDATVESHIYQVALSDALLTHLLFQSVKDAELGWIDARIVRRRAIGAGEEGEEQTVAEVEPEVEEMEQEGEEDGAERAAKRMKSDRPRDTFYLDALPSHKIPSHQAVLVNDPKLTEVKQLLLAEGITAEFSSGVLCIAGVASIRRNEAGRFHVEGCAGEEYYRIRDLIYNQFAIV